MESIENIFSPNYSGNEEDLTLVKLANQGDYDSMEKLILRHQTWIYNISLRMTGNPQDAEDATQEVLIKMMTKLSTFMSNSSFRTWLYRIVSNHVLNMKRSAKEAVFTSFEDHRNIIDTLCDDFDSRMPEQAALIEETKLQCMQGMLLCLDRRQRLIFILGALWQIDSALGAEIAGISSTCFRKDLSRVRNQLKNYMNEECSLIDKSGSCRCARKTKAAVAAGFVDPSNLQFCHEHVYKVKDFVLKCAPKADDKLSTPLEASFREKLYRESRDYTRILQATAMKMEFAWNDYRNNAQ